MARFDRSLRRVIASEHKVFGDTVTYTPAGGGAVELSGIFFTRDTFHVQSLGGLEAALPRVEFASDDIAEAGLDPANGDVLSLEVRGESRTYIVMRVEKPDEGSIVCHLGARS
ncbi:MAG: hypothetical protein IT379_24590 [Deltaproteobacteria bacterium]|nr:hypothetical protein [Deltaproteobacteria bacterium]